jgi:hypothetical protein
VAINSSRANTFSAGVEACLNLFSASKYSGGRLAGILKFYHIAKGLKDSRIQAKFITRILESRTSWTL